MKEINLAIESSEFCVKRTDPNLPKIIELLDQAVLKQSPIQVEWSQVKILTPSYIDELLPKLIIKHGEANFWKYVQFKPALTGFLHDQIAIGVKNRS